MLSIVFSYVVSLQVIRRYSEQYLIDTVKCAIIQIELFFNANSMLLHFKLRCNQGQ